MATTSRHLESIVRVCTYYYISVAITNCYQILLLCFSFHFRHILIKNQPVELSDNLFIKNLIIFKKWLYIEEIAEDQNNIREAFIKFIKPKKTLW